MVALDKEILYCVVSVFSFPSPYRLVQVLPTLDFAQLSCLVLVRRPSEDDVFPNLVRSEFGATVT